MQSFFIQTAKIFNKTKFFYIIPSEFKFKVIILFFLSLIGLFRSDWCRSNFASYFINH